MGIDGFLVMLFAAVIAIVVALYVLTIPGAAGGIASYISTSVSSLLAPSLNNTITGTCKSSVQAKLNYVAGRLPPSVEMSILNTTLFKFGANNGQNINMVNAWLSQWSLIGNSSQGALTTSLMCPTTDQLGYFCGSVNNLSTYSAGVVVKVDIQKYNSNLAYRIPVLCGAVGNVSTITPASANYLISEIPSLAR